MIRVFNYHNKEKVVSLEAHSDYVRAISVHPTHPYILSSSDDYTIRMFDWENNWKVRQIFEGHSHFVMSVVFSPSDSNTFASAALDNTIRFWQLGSAVPNFTLEGHRGGVNCIGFYQGPEKPYLVSGADDRTVKVWDYQTKTCLQTLIGHSDNVTAICFHPTLPIILSGSEDGTIRIWHSSTYRLENTLNYGLGRVWALALLTSANHVAAGCEHGSIVIKLGDEDPPMSMDCMGKLVWAKHNEIQQTNVKTAMDGEVVDGEPLVLATKDLGSCEIYPNVLQHSPNGRFIVVCGDGEYIIYTALAWRNKSYGSSLEFVWAVESGYFAIRESSTRVTIYKNFKEKRAVPLDFSAEGLFGGRLLGVRSSDSLAFYDWDIASLVARIEITPKLIIWAPSGDLVVIAAAEKFFVLEYYHEVVTAHVEQGLPIPEEGILEAFQVIGELTSGVQSGVWAGDCFVYVDAKQCLNYFVGRNDKCELVTVQHLPKPMRLLGYLPKESRLYLADKDFAVVSYHLDIVVMEYQTRVLRGEIDSATELLPKIHEDQRLRIAHFLEKQGYLQQAFQLTGDPDHQFSLALSLNNLDAALDIARRQDKEAQWRKLGDAAMRLWNFDVAKDCLQKAGDYSGLLLLYSAAGDARGIAQLAQTARDTSKNNVAFICYFLLQRLDDCLQLLLDTDRIPEAALFARSYAPSKVSDITRLWRERLQAGNSKTAYLIADPKEYSNLFPDWSWALEAEQRLRAEGGAWSVPANLYEKFCQNPLRDLVAVLKAEQSARSLAETLESSGDQKSPEGHVHYTE